MVCLLFDPKRTPDATKTLANSTLDACRPFFGNEPAPRRGDLDGGPWRDRRDDLLYREGRGSSGLAQSPDKSIVHRKDSTDCKNQTRRPPMCSGVPLAQLQFVAVVTMTAKKPDSSLTEEPCATRKFGEISVTIIGRHRSIVLASPLMTFNS